MMQLTPEQAMGALQLYIQDYEFDRTATGKVLAALPDSGASYSPDAASRTAVDLAWHIASVEKAFLDGVADGQFDMSVTAMPEGMTPSKVYEWWQKEVPASLEKVKALTPEGAARILDFMGAFQLPAFVFMGWAVKHTLHHRGQLTAYLRAAGGKVPAIYGGSHDEPWQPA
jgi:uncharacterized damage-inducible protein DinB